MYNRNYELVKGYVELISILSINYEFKVENNVLFGINKNTGHIFSLAKKRERGVNFYAADGVKGVMLIEHICNLHSKTIKNDISKLNSSDLILQLAQKVTASLGLMKKYSDIY